jgi:hypothetical protein
MDPFALGPPGFAVPALLGLANVAVAGFGSIPRRRFEAAVRARNESRVAAGAIALRVHTINDADHPVLVASAYGTRETNWDRFVATTAPITVEDDHGTRYRLTANAAMQVTLPVGISMRYLRTDAFEGGTRVYGFDLHPRRPFWISAVPSRTPEGSFRERPDGVLAPAEATYLVAETEALLAAPKVPPLPVLLAALTTAFALLAGLATVDLRVWIAIVVLDALLLVTLAIVLPIAAGGTRSGSSAPHSC